MLLCAGTAGTSRAARSSAPAWSSATSRPRCTTPSHHPAPSACSESSTTSPLLPDRRDLHALRVGQPARGLGLDAVRHRVGLAALGLAIKLTPLARVRGLSTGSYLAMGWTVLIAIKPVLAHVPLGGVWLLLDGGLCYTAGVIFYAWKRLPFSHALWHLLVLARNAFHVFAGLYYVIPPAS